MDKILSPFFSYSAHLTVMTWADGTVYRHRTLYCTAYIGTSCRHAPEDFIPVRIQPCRTPYA